MKIKTILLVLMLIFGSITCLSKELPDDINKLTKMAQKGNVDAQVKLANIYYNGEGVEPNYDEAKYYYELAVNKNSPLGLVGLGNCYLNGLGVTEDASEAFNLFKKAADMGSIEGKAELSYCYYFGYGVDKNFEEAYKLAAEAASHGNAEGEFIVGNCYYYGRGGVEEDSEESFNYFYNAYKDGFLEAGVMLGRCFLYGKGVETNEELAFKLFLEAYDLEFPGSSKNLGTCLFYGWGTQKDPDKAFQLFLQAQEEGEDVNYSLGNCYLEGVGVEVNLEKAAEYYKKDNSASGINKIAEAFLKGKGVEKNYDEAFKYYQMAADMGSSVALNEIGDMYYNGYLGPINYIEAVKYYRKSIETGYEYAMKNLARCYVFGQGVPQSYEEAEKLYKKLEDDGNEVEDELYNCKIKGNYYRGLLKLFQQPLDVFTTMILEDNKSKFYMMEEKLEYPFNIKKMGNSEVLDFKIQNGLPNHTFTSKDNGMSWTGIIGTSEGKKRMDFWLLKWPYAYYFCYMNPIYLKPIICDPKGYNVIIVFEDPQSGTLAAKASANFKENGLFSIKYENPLMTSNFKSIQGTYSIESPKIILNADEGTTLEGYIRENGDFIFIDMGRISGLRSALYFIR